MTGAIKPACELGRCHYFRLEEMSDETRAFIFSECLKNLNIRMEHDPEFQPTDCPQAAFTAAVMTELASREGEIE